MTIQKGEEGPLREAVLWALLLWALSGDVGECVVGVIQEFYLG